MWNIDFCHVIKALLTDLFPLVKFYLVTQSIFRKILRALFFSLSFKIT